jgi:hypothetical protein
LIRITEINTTRHFSDNSESDEEGGITRSGNEPSMQCAAAAAKSNRIMGQLCRAVQWRDKITFPKLCMSHVRPVLEYAGTVWCPYLVGDRETLEKVQKRMVRIIPGLRGSYEDRVDPANWFILQGDLVRDGATSTRGHRGYQALLAGPQANLEVRRERTLHEVSA